MSLPSPRFPFAGALLVAGLCYAGSSSAALIAIDPVTGVTSSSEVVGVDRIDDYVVDGSGLTGNQHSNSNGDGTQWLSAAPGFGGLDADPFIEFDLGAVYTISSFTVWNSNRAGFTNRGVNFVSVQYGTTAALGSNLDGEIDSFAEATGLSNYTGETFVGGTDYTTFDARYIRFDVSSAAFNDATAPRNHGSNLDIVGLSEVQFNGTIIPEPGSLALLAVGSLCTMRRRRA